MTVTRRTLLGTIAALPVGLAVAARAEDAWPTRLVRLISPYGPGGSNDISLRLLADEFSRSLHQQFIVENKPGAGTRIANDLVAHAPGDGYTILYVAAPYATAEELFGKLTYERKDLRPVAMAVVAPLFLIISADAPFKTLPELIAYGKAKPQGLTFASPGAGSQPHLAGEILFRDAGVKGLNIPFRGDAASYTELLAGRVDATLTALPTALPYIQSGKFTVLGVASAERSALYPQAPTLREQGLGNVVAAGWYGFMVPSTTPQPIIDKIEAEVLRALAEPVIKDKLTAQGLEVRAGTATAFAKFIDDETRKWSALIRNGPQGRMTFINQGMEMTRHLLNLAAASAFILALSAPSAQAQKKYDPGASDTVIKVGQTVPLSGPASAYAVIGKTQAAYMRMINDQGGVNGRKIELIQYDDAYSPPKTVEQIRKLVESDEVLLTFQIIGTAPNVAVQKYLNAKKVPQLFAATGAARFTDPKNFPWTMGFNPSYLVEGRIYAQYILKNHPNAKIGVLYQNDDLGKDYLAGLKAGLGDKAAEMVVAETSYEITEPTIDSQILRLKDAGADVLFSATTPKQAAQAIKKTAEIGWKPLHIIDINASSVSAVLKPAGLENAKGVISVGYVKDSADAEWQDDPGMKRYLAFMAKYYPDGDKGSNLNVYGYITAQLLVQVLKQCGDDLTRESVMRQAANLKNVVLDLTLPGISVTTSPTDYRVNKQFQMVQFDGQRWQKLGDIITDEARE